jgi:hypothetical protein
MKQRKATQNAADEVPEQTVVQTQNTKYQENQTDLR